MTSTRKKSTSSNSSDKEKDFLEEEFLKCSIDDIPVPKEGLEKYEKEVLEVMKSGCNRQIAEYVILEYKKLEEEEKKENKNNKSLYELKEEYDKIGTKVINAAIQDLEKDINKNEKKVEENELPLEGFEDEIEEIMENPKIQKLKESNNNEGLENIEYNILFNLKNNIDSLNEETKEKFYSLRKAYVDKREAVIEAALRHVKKIVNDDNEYKKFYKAYYGKDEPED